MPLGPVELGLILLVVLLVCGAGKLASLGGALGKSIKDFRRELGLDPTPNAEDRGNQ